MVKNDCTPVHKKGYKTDPSNHRAISLLSIPGKVFSHILFQRIKQKREEFTKENQLGSALTGVLLTKYLLYVKLSKKQKNARWTYTLILLILNQPLTQFWEKLFGKYYWRKTGWVVQCSSRSKKRMSSLTNSV